jgi:hypothetical protein
MKCGNYNNNSKAILGFKLEFTLFWYFFCSFAHTNWEPNAEIWRYSAFYDSKRSSSNVVNHPMMKALMNFTFQMLLMRWKELRKTHSIGFCNFIYQSVQRVLEKFWWINHFWFWKLATQYFLFIYIQSSGHFIRYNSAKYRSVWAWFGHDTSIGDNLVKKAFLNSKTKPKL